MHICSIRLRISLCLNEKEDVEQERLIWREKNEMMEMRGGRRLEMIKERIFSALLWCEKVEHLQEDRIWKISLNFEIFGVNAGYCVLLSLKTKWMHFVWIKIIMGGDYWDFLSKTLENSKKIQSRSRFLIPSSYSPACCILQIVMIVPQNYSSCIELYITPINCILNENYVA